MWLDCLLQTPGAEALGLTEQFAERSQRGVDRVRVFPRTAELFQRLRRDEFDQQIGCPRRNPLRPLRGGDHKKPIGLAVIRRDLGEELVVGNAG